MFICSELIEETGRPPGLVSACGDIFGPARTSSSFVLVLKSVDILVL